MKNIRKPYIAVFLASLMLFISCNNEMTFPKIESNNKFDYTAFESFKTGTVYAEIINEIKNSNLDFKSEESTYEMNKKILKIVNDKLGTDLVFPDEALKLSVETGEDLIFATSIENGWMSNEDVSLSKDFFDNIQSKGFEDAVEVYQSKIINLELSPEEFAKKNSFVNIMKSLDYENPDLFEKNSELLAKSNSWRCALAVVALAATTAGLIGCATIAGCALAVLLQVNAVYAFNDHCLN